jgi:cellulose synthase/poly-beta-1,6-N-acetylglucosamine synthase-like glycosyltransferase/spore germination protein YaaH/peptidoglycan/xylan/chitin deacetylase (PgdA/CDA1 family)
VLGFVVGWDPASVKSLEAHAGDLTHVVAEAFSLGEPSGTLRDSVAPAVLTAARRHGLPVLALVSNYDGSWRPERVRRLWATAGVRTAFAAALAREAERRGFGGVNIDFENLTPSDRAGLTALCRSLAVALRARRLLLTIDVPVGRSSAAAGAYDLAALSWSCDFMVVMAYDEHGATSDPGPVASRDWSLRELASVRQSVPATKLVVGLGAYGYDWGPSSPAQVTGFSRALTTARSNGAAVRWDPAVRAPTFEYKLDGVRHRVWFEDAASASSRIAMARQGRFAGLSIWRLGAEDPALWTELQAYRQGRELHDTTDSALSLADVVHLQGEGDFLTVTPGVTGGRRRFERRTGEIVAEQYPELPAAFLVQRAGLPRQREVALTFDDGPDPEYTPRVLDLLWKEKVPATFFVVGSRVEAYPELVRRIYQEGHDLGNHTYSHVNMLTAGPLRTRLELNATQRLIETTTHHRTLFFRPPYDTDSRPETRAELLPLLRASEEGYVTVAAAIDPADWSQRDPRRIVERCLRDGADGGVIVLHDAGGDRSATVRALPLIIHALRARGCHFVPLHELIGRSRGAVMPAGAANSWQSSLMALTVFCLNPAAHLFAVIAFLGLALSLLRALIVLPLAWWHYRCASRVRGCAGAKGQGAGVRKGPDRLTPDPSPLTPAVSVLVAAFNEEQVIGKTLTHLLASDYPNLELLVIDDGSTDDTRGAVAPFLRDPRVRYRRIENSGKGAALNHGVQASRGEIVVMLDADTLFERATISRLVQHFEDPEVGAVAGNIKVGNRRGLLTQWQSLEYIVAINLEKRFFDVLNCITVVPGSVGAWRRDALVRTGGFSLATLAEDTDLTFSVRRAGYRIRFEPAAIAWTEAPATVWALAKQRLRWVFGTFQCLWKHRNAFLRPHAGTFGLVAMPYVLLFHVLQVLLGPMMDAAIVGMCLMGQGTRAAVLGVAFLAMEWLLAAIALAFDREPKWPLLLVPLQRLIYRYIIYWVALRAALCVLRGTHPGWQKLARSGTAAVVTPSVLAAAFFLAPGSADAMNTPTAHAVSSPTATSASTPASSSVGSGATNPATGVGTSVSAGHLPAGLFDFEEFWDLVDGHGAVVGVQGGAYPQPVSDARGRGVAVRSGVSAVAALSLDRTMTLSLEQFQGQISRPGLANDQPLSSAWTSLKLTRRVARGTTLSLQQWVGDATATGFSLAHGHTWGRWEADLGIWADTDTHNMGLDTSYAGFDASLSRALGHGLRLGTELEGPLVRGQQGSLTLQYAPDERTDATLALRQWYGTTLLELRGSRHIGREWQVGAAASSRVTLSLFAKRRL